MARPPGVILREIRDDLGLSRTLFAGRLPSRWSAEIVRNLEIGRTKVVHYHVEDLLDAGLLSITEDRYQEIREGIEERDERDIEGEVTEGERVQALSEMLLALDAKMDAMEQADRAGKEIPSAIEERPNALEANLNTIDRIFTQISKVQPPIYISAGVVVCVFITLVLLVIHFIGSITS